MRVYLKESVQFETESLRVLCPRAGFYNIPDPQALLFIACGKAFEATKDNRVIGYANDSAIPVTVDIEVGDGLDHLSPFCTAAVAEVEYHDEEVDEDASN